MTQAYVFHNAGGGCGDLQCDYQVQCPACSRASQRQYDEWFVRVGKPRSMFRLVIDGMHEQVHAEAIAANFLRSAGAR